MPIFRRRGSDDSVSDAVSSRSASGSSASSSSGGGTGTSTPSFRGSRLTDLIGFLPRRFSQDAAATATATEQTLDPVPRNYKPFDSVYQRSTVCGVGSSAVVWVVTEVATGHCWACKVVSRAAPRRPTATGQGPLPGHGELEILRQLGKHECILGVREYFIEDDRVYLIMELMEEGTDLLSLVLERGTFCEQDAREVFTRLLQALGHCHARGVAHRDVKLDNIVIANSEDISSVKLIDFGLAGQLTPEMPFLTDRCGTPAFAAPEVLRRSPAYDTRCDIWSAGTALYTLLCGEPPFKAESLSELVKAIHKPELVFDDPAWALVSSEAVDLVRRLLTPDPNKRLSLRQALEHPWICK